LKLNLYWSSYRWLLVWYTSYTVYYEARKCFLTITLALFFGIRS